MLKGLTHTLGSTADGTAEFALMFDKFFDSMNVSNFDNGKHEHKDPYRSATDFQLKVVIDRGLHCFYHNSNCIHFGAQFSTKEVHQIDYC